MWAFSFTKMMASLVMAIVMYWLYIPRPIEILLYMMALDLVMGSVYAWVNGQFTARVFGQGVLRKFVYFPMLVACHLIEDPLALTFHLETYFADALVAYEFLSISENYAKLGGPVPKFMNVITAKAKDLFATVPPEIQAIKTTDDVVQTKTVKGKVTEKTETHTESVVEPVPKASTTQDPPKS